MKRHDATKVWVIEDDPIMGQSLVDALELEDFAVELFEDGETALRARAAGAAPDIVACDIRLPGSSGEEVYTALRSAGFAGPVLFMTAYGEIDQAVRLIRGGASDYVTKPFEMKLFLERLAGLAPQARGATPLGVSEAMLEIDDLIHRIADQDGPVLITGETGVGKEVAARRLHEVSRADKPFVAVNCAAIPAELLESELFGYERGAFTGASARHAGYAERARDGVLFLDEIAEMPLALQPKLLRLLEAKSFHRLGSEKATPFKARVVAATNRNVRHAAQAGQFREDLLYRLDMFAIDIPPLRERPDDVEWLLEELVGPASANARRAIRPLSALAIEAARSYSWPGNVRELRFKLERAVVFAQGPALMPADLFPPARIAPRAPSGPLANIRDAAERRAIDGALRDAGGEMQEAARLLGISRTTLWEKIRRLGSGE